MSYENLKSVIEIRHRNTNQGEEGGYQGFVNERVYVHPRISSLVHVSHNSLIAVHRVVVVVMMVVVMVDG